MVRSIFPTLACMVWPFEVERMLAKRDNSVHAQAKISYFVIRQPERKVTKHENSMTGIFPISELILLYR